MNEILVGTLTTTTIAVILLIIWIILKNKDRNKTANKMEELIDATISSFP